jgi:hypothetical protein
VLLRYMGSVHSWNIMADELVLEFGEFACLGGERDAGVPVEIIGFVNLPTAMPFSDCWSERRKDPSAVCLDRSSVC